MTQEERKMVQDILDTKSVGYAYAYPLEGAGRKEYMLSLSLENLANFIGIYGLESDTIIITDMFDRLVANTQMWYLDICPDQKLCWKLMDLLSSIHMGERETSPPLVVSRTIAEEYFQEKDQMATELEMQ